MASNYISELKIFLLHIHPKWLYKNAARESCVFSPNTLLFRFVWFIKLLDFVCATLFFRFSFFIFPCILHLIRIPLAIDWRKYAKFSIHNMGFHAFADVDFSNETKWLASAKFKFIHWTWIIFSVRRRDKTKAKWKKGKWNTKQQCTTVQKHLKVKFLYSIFWKLTI